MVVVVVERRVRTALSGSDRVRVPLLDDERWSRGPSSSDEGSGASTGERRCAYLHHEAFRAILHDGFLHSGREQWLVRWVSVTRFEEVASVEDEHGRFRSMARRRSWTLTPGYHYCSHRRRCGDQM